MPTRTLALGRARLVSDGPESARPFGLPAHHLVTHGVVAGMTGSGKTGLSMIVVEEALRSGVPVLMIDVKGDLGNLLLTFPSLAPADFEPWIDPIAAEREGRTVQQEAASIAARFRDGLARDGLSSSDVAELRARFAPRLITPGSTAGEPLHVLSALESPSALWSEDEELAREALSASISLLLRLIGRDADPAKSREHVVLSHFAERRLRAGGPAGLAELLADLAKPPIHTLGALAIDDFLPPKDRAGLAQQLNTLLASPTFASWRRGASLDVEQWMRPQQGKTPAVIVSVAHLDDAEREVVLGLLLDQILAWVRVLPGTSDLRALVLFDEVFGFLPPHPANPATKRPLLTLLKQARAFGVGVVVATQNPMDLDYKALSNAGVWFVGRLQTDADRERVVEGLSSAAPGADLDPAALAATLKSLPPRTFFVRDVHHTPSSMLLETRCTLSWLRGPLTRREITRLAKMVGAPTNSAPSPEPAPQVESPAALPAAPPSAPEGWKTVFAQPPSGPAPAASRYVPWVAATVVAHLRDAKLGVARNCTRTVAAPLAADGRPDVTRARYLDPKALALGPSPAPGIPFAPLPEALDKRSTLQAAERALKEHVLRSLKIPLDVHAALELVREEGEAPEAFLNRCREAAARRVAAERQEIADKHAPKIAKLAERKRIAESRLASAQAELSALPGALGTALIGLVAGSRTARKAESQRARAEARVEKAAAELDEAFAALRMAEAARDAELAATRDADHVRAGVEQLTLSVKKGNVEVIEIALAWGIEWSGHRGSRGEAFS
jgi:hypothetical protein